jgi:Carbohydrate binding module (family 6)/Fibronectin type III domain
MRKAIAVCALSLFFASLAGSGALAQVAYTTQHNDNMRSGDNLNETILNQSNVNVSTFGMLFKESVDDQVYATPLYMPDLTVNGATHNVVFVATVNNTVYAFDADKGGTALWSRNFGTPTNHTQVGQGGFCGAGGYNDFQGNIGIVGTPVIDPSTDTMYFVAHTVNGGAHTQTLHAISILSGADRASNASVVISGGGFNSMTNNQRPALTLANGTVYIAWSSYCDVTPYNGIVMAYTASTLAQTAVFNDTSSGGANGQGGIWQAGQGLNVDSAGNLYVMTGNGTWNGTSSYGESFVKLNPTNLTVEDYFTPSDYATLNGNDEDVGSAGGLLIPGTNLLVGGGKSAIFYLLNTNNMGHETGNDAGAMQEFQAGVKNPNCTFGHIHGGPVYYDSASLGPLIYVWSENDFMHEFKFDGSTFTSTSPFANSSMSDAECGMPGVMMSLSADGNNDSTAIVWGNGVLSGDANHATVPGILRAFNATNVNQELWDSQKNAARDSCGNFAKDGYPVIANGKVYLGSFGTANAGSGQLCVYGLIATTPEGPFGGTPAAIPGTAMAENYDTGGQGVGYNVTSVNGTANGYRSDGVDLEAASAPATGNNLGWTAAGQWFRYTVNVSTAGTYTVSFLVAGNVAVADAFHLSNSAGTNLTGSVAVPATGGWQNWTTVTATVTLPAGTQTLTLNEDNGGWNIDSMRFASSGGGCTAVSSAPTGLTAAAVSSSVIGLNWTAVTPPANCTISSYSVYRSTTSGFTPSSSNLIASGVTSTSYSSTGLTASTTYYYIVEAVDAAGNSPASAQASATTSASGEGPFGGTPAAVPGTVQAENYDTGGQGVAYNVTTVNGSDNGYRSDGVDLEVTTDTGGGVNLGWTAAGQWFKYTVNVATAGTYTVTFRVAAESAIADAFHISNSAGTNLSGSVAVPNTGAWQTWTSVTATVTLPAGVQTLTVNQDNPGWNLNWFSLASAGGGEGPFGGTPAAIPGTVMAENYDTGGQGVGYNVTSTNGTANGYRSDGVDLEPATAPATGNDLGWTATGQWFRYTVNVSTAGTYTVSFLVAGDVAVADAFHLSNSAGTNLTGSVAVPATGGWQDWTTVTATVTLPAGTQTLTLNEDNAGWNIDSIAAH